jgi:hypothetical protein
MIINRVGDPKTRLGTDRTACMRIGEFVGLEPAVLQKSDENFPTCGTIVQGSALNGSIYGIKIHSGGKLNLKAPCVTRQLVADRIAEMTTEGHHLRQACSCYGHENNTRNLSYVLSSGTLGRPR